MRGVLYLAYLAIILVFNDARLLLVASWRSRRHRRPLAERFVQTQASRLLKAASLIAGLRVEYESPLFGLPEQFVLVTNHQSLVDIPVLIATFRPHHLKFVAKRELLRGVPSVSKSLRYSDQAFIDRTGPFHGSHVALLRLAAATAGPQHGAGGSAVIFPEGTRSRDGRLRRFHTAGFRVLAREMHLPVVVAAVDGGWRMRSLAAFGNMGRHPYRIAPLLLRRAPEGKVAALAALDAAHDAIADKLERWRVIDTSTDRSTAQGR